MIELAESFRPTLLPLGLVLSRIWLARGFGARTQAPENLLGLGAHMGARVVESLRHDRSNIDRCPAPGVVGQGVEGQEPDIGGRITQDHLRESVRRNSHTGIQR